MLFTCCPIRDSMTPVLDTVRSTMLADSLRTRRRNIKAIPNFMSFQKNDDKPHYEIIFGGDGITQLKFLEAEITTRLDNSRVVIAFFNGNDSFQDKVGIGWFRYFSC